jgi:hypothetical protein
LDGLRIVSVGRPPGGCGPVKSQIPPWPAPPPYARKVESARAIQGATYIFIIEPVLDTTESRTT